MALQGRFHYYEGFSMKEVAYPVYVMKLLGIDKMIVTNASGGKTMSAYKLKTGKVGEAVVGAYKKIEDTVIGGYKKIEEAFVDAFLEKVDDAETSAETKVQQ